MLVADTHAFLWHLSQDGRLGKRARRAFEDCDNRKETIVIPSIVLVESMFLCEKQRIGLKFEEILLKLKLASNYKVYPLDEQTVLKCASLKLPTRTTG